MTLSRILTAKGALGLNSTLGRRLASGASWSLLSEAGSRALTFVSGIVVARLLGVFEFGLFALIQGTLAMSMTFVMFGMSQTTTRYVALLRHEDPDRLGALSRLMISMAAVMGLLGAVLLFVFAPTVAQSIDASSGLDGPLRLSAPALALGALTGGFTGSIRGFEAFDRLARVGWVASLAGLVAITIGAIVAGLSGAVIGFVAGEALRTALVARVTQRLMRQHGTSLFGHVNLKEAKVLWHFSVPALLGGALHVPVFWLCQIVIGRQPNGIYQLGLYNAAQRWQTLVTFAPIAAAGVMAPVLASLGGQRDFGSHRTLTMRVALIQTVVCVLPAVVIALGAPLAMNIFGPRFASGTAVIIWMMALAPISVLIRLFWEALLSLGHAWLSFSIWVLWSAVALGLTWMWRSAGAVGLSQATLAAYSLALGAYLISMHLIWRK